MRNHHHPFLPTQHQAPWGDGGDETANDKKTSVLGKAGLPGDQDTGRQVAHLSRAIREELGWLPTSRAP